MIAISLTFSFLRQFGKGLWLTLPLILRLLLIDGLANVIGLAVSRLTAAGRLYGNYLVSMTMTGPHVVRRMLPTAYGTV